MSPPELRGAAANRAAWLWGSVVTAFLILQLIIGGLAFSLASKDPSVAVMPNYHERALRWDDEVASRRLSDSLGWQVTAVIHEPSPTGGKREIEFRLVDANSAPVSDAQAEIEYFHHARAGEFANHPLRETGPGIYAAELPLLRKGLWEIDLTAIRSDAERFRWTRTVDLADDSRIDIQEAHDSLSEAPELGEASP